MTNTDSILAETERMEARNTIVRTWDARKREISARMATTPRDERVALGALYDQARRRAAGELEPLDYVVLDGDGIDTIVDVRTGAGLLAVIRRAERDRLDAEEQVELAATRRDEAIRAAIALGALDAPVSRIAAAAGLTPARVYQIRDGRR